jgi:hypothetical protein
MLGVQKFVEILLTTYLLLQQQIGKCAYTSPLALRYYGCWYGYSDDTLAIFNQRTNE